MRQNKHRRLAIIILFSVCISSFHSSATINEKHDSITDHNAQKLFETSSSQSYDGYTVYSPEYGKNAYLINDDGEVMHMWSSDYIQGMGTYLLEDGSLIRACIPWTSPTFPFAGFTGKVERFDWDGNLIWDFNYLNDTVCLHHDICVLPDGNILMIAWEYKSKDNVIAAGRNPDLMPWNYLCFDHIIEVEPTGESGGRIVWEWHIWDHLIQDYDSTKENYGTVEDHPELIDMNYLITDSFWQHDVWNQDLFHSNAIDYNEELDQILLSVRNFNEIWIIDHSTTSEEAMSHHGGNSGKGGDLLYRWGNPATYKRGTVDDKKLFFQHDAQWIDTGLPGEGHILLFNNGINRPDEVYSSVDELIPPLNEYDQYTLSDSMVYGPENLIWEYTAAEKTTFFSLHLSSVQRLPNGNTLVCHGDYGYFFEVTPDGEIVWEYYNPYPQTIPKDVYKIRKYPLNYSGIGEFDNIQPSNPDKPIGEGYVNPSADYSYKTSSFDPNGDLLFYLFDWDDGSTPDWIGPFMSGEEVISNHSWSSPGLYQVKVKSQDSSGLESGWSDVLNIIVKPLEVWLFGRITGISEESNGILLSIKSLTVLRFSNHIFIRYPQGTQILIDDEYKGIVTENRIAGQFYVKSIN